MSVSRQAAVDKQSILVVDDAPENLRLLLSSLTEAGYAVRCARSGELALAGAKALPPDLILLDILMPQMDGFEVCERFRQNDQTRHIPVIFLSALDDGSDKARAFALGGDDYIAKPFSIEEVLARIQYQLKVKGRERGLQQLTEQYQHSIARYRQENREWQSAYRFLREVLDSVTDGIAAFQLIHDGEGDLDFEQKVANAAFARLFQVDKEFVANTGITLRELTSRYSDCELLDLCIQVVQTNISLNREVLCQMGDQQLWIEVFATKLRDGVVACLRDIRTAKQKIDRLEAENRELYQLATTDRLTRVANRYAFDTYLEAEWHRSLREQQPLSLVLGDIDKFKRFNDLCGHSVGDRCLQAVAQAIQQTVKRPADMVARYGGEEFAILLPGTPQIGAIAIADQIQSAVRTLRLTDTASPECEQVYISLGIASLVPQRHLYPFVLIDAADRALYRAKDQGGNTYCVERL